MPLAECKDRKILAEIQKQLLEEENVEVREDYTVDLDKYIW